MLEKQVEEMKSEVATASQNFKVRSIVSFLLDYVFAKSCLPLGYRFEDRGCSDSNQEAR